MSTSLHIALLEYMVPDEPFVTLENYFLDRMGRAVMESKYPPSTVPKLRAEPTAAKADRTLIEEAVRYYRDRALVAEGGAMSQRIRATEARVRAAALDAKLAALHAPEVVRAARAWDMARGAGDVIRDCHTLAAAVRRALS